MRGLTRPSAIVRPQRLQAARPPNLGRLVEVGVPQEMVRLVVAVAVRRRGARKALVARDQGRVVPRVPAVLRALGAPVARPVPVRQMARGSIGRGRAPALLVVRVSIVLRVKPLLVIRPVASQSLSRRVGIRAVRRIVSSILLTGAVCASLSVTRTPASMEIRASSVTAPLLRRSAPVVRSPLNGPRARRSDR